MLDGDIINEEQFMGNIDDYLSIIDLPNPSIDCVIIKDNSNYIHPTAIIGKKVKLGKGNYIGANCYIVGDTTIGDNNHFEAFVSVGSFPEHREYFHKKESKGVEIGNNNLFREFVTINSGTSRNTIVKNECWFLKGSHVGHDSIIDDKVTMGCNVVIGGHCYVMEGATFGLGVVCHQFSIIGAYCMIGMNGVVGRKQPIIPFGIYIGNPSKYAKINEVKTRTLDSEHMERLRSSYKLIAKNGNH
jgi:UDP-N-acetylglucosamine acyltransferase